MAEQYGREADFDLYRELLPHKTAEQIGVYSKVFWARYTEIENGSKLVERIVKGEAII